MDFVKYGVGWIIALVAISAGAYYFVYNKRRKKLQYDTRVTSLIAPVKENKELEITYSNRKVNNPYIVDIELTNVGAKDISSKDFDADKPLAFDLVAEIVAPMDFPSNHSINPLQVTLDGTKLSIQPTKLAINSRHHLRLLVDGKPDLTVAHDPLIDTDLVTGAEARKREQRINDGINKFMSGVLPILLAVTVAGAVLSEKVATKTVDIWIIKDFPTEPLWFAIYVVAIFLVYVLISLLLMYYLLRQRRRAKQIKEANEFYGYSVAKNS